MHCHEAAGHQSTTFHGISVYYSHVKPPLWKNRCLLVMVVLCGMNSKIRTFWVPKNCCHDLSSWLLHTKFLQVGDPLCFHCVDSCLVSGSRWWTHFSSSLIILEKRFSGFALSMSKFSSLNCWLQFSGVNIHDTHQELTFYIIKTKWMNDFLAARGLYFNFTRIWNNFSYHLSCWKLCQLKCPVQEL